MIDTDVDSIDLQAYFQQYQKYISRLRLLSDATVNAYITDIEAFFSYNDTNIFFSKEEIHDAIRGYIASLTEEKKSANTINRVLSSLRGFFRHLVRLDALKQNPMSNIANIKRRRVLPKVLFPSELEELLCIHGDDFLSIRNNAILEMLYSTGMRVQELAFLKINDVLRSNGAIFIRGKNRRYRYVFMGGKAQSAIMKYLKIREEMLRKKNLASPEQLLINFRGEGLTVRGAQWIVDIFSRKSKLKKSVSPHTFRHSFATHVMQNGANVRVVQELLGHKRLSTTQIYTHLDVKRLQEVCNKVHPHAKNNRRTKND